MEFMTTVFQGTAPAAGSAAAGALSTAELISGGVSNFALMVGGFTQGSALKTQAKYAELQAEQAHVQGVQQTNDVRERLLRTLAQNRAAGASSGVGSTSGTVVAGMDEARAQANRELSVVKGDARLTELGLRRTASDLKGQAKVTNYGTAIIGGMGLAGLAAKRARLGSANGGP